MIARTGIERSNRRAGGFGRAGGLARSVHSDANLLFESVEEYEASFALHAQEILDDIPKYSNCEPIVQVGEVKLWPSLIAQP